MPFVIFEDTRARTKEYISVTDNKSFGLPRTFLNSQSITSSHKAVILYDETEKKVALTFTLNDPKFGLAVRIPNDHQGGMVVAKSFFDTKKIDPRKYSGRYEFEKVSLKDIGIDKDDDAYVITLKEKEPEPSPEMFEEPWAAPDEDRPIDLSEIPF